MPITITRARTEVLSVRLTMAAKLAGNYERPGERLAAFIRENIGVVALLSR